MGGADGDGGWRLRGYTIERLIGRGSFGEVWRARVSSNGEPVALKRIPVDGIGELQHAEREAALLSMLDHPHLVRLHAFVPTDDAAVLVLDLADGGSLADLLDARGRLTPGEVITAIAPVAAALAYLHGEGVVHGDISAANVLLTHDGVSLLGDVGVARLVGDRGEIACTPAYVDPTVAAGGVPGPPSDVFSLAAVALHALTGQPAWPDGTSTGALAHAQAGDAGQAVRFAERLKAAGTPMAMAAVICRALAIDPHRRGTAADLALDLRHSGRPVAVELAAGRRRADIAAEARRPPGPRHAARVGPAPTASAAPVVASMVDSAGRPGFERPAMPVVDDSAPPTRLVGLRPRPVVPRSRSGLLHSLRHGLRDRFGRRLVLLGCAALTAVLVAAGGTVWAATRPGPVVRHDAGPRSSPVRPNTPSRSSSSSSSSSSSAAPAQPRSTPRSPTAPASDQLTGLPISRRDAAAALAALDAVRADAFRRRDDGMLARIYVAGPLRSADRTTMHKDVPRGCGLVGVRTTYDDVHVRRRGSSVVVTATATLSTSRLMCDGRLRGHAAGTVATPIRVELVRTPAGLRIAAQHLG